MPRERTTRRKSIYVKPKWDPALGPPPDAMETDEVESLYADQRTHYRAPEDRELETLFEAKDADNGGNAEDGNGNGGGRRPKRKCAANEELSVGKYLAKRKLEPTPFFLEDPIKTKHRVKMSKKVGNNKKKGTARFKALSPGQEVKLAQLIADKADTTFEGEEDTEKENAVAASENSTATIEPVFKTPATRSKRTGSMSSASRSGLRRRRNSSSGVLTPRTTTSPESLLKSPSPGPSPSSSSPFGLCTPGNPVPDVDFATVQTPETEAERLRDLMALEAARMSQESLRAQIEQADSLFGVVAGTDEDCEGEEEERLEDEEEEAAKTSKGASGMKKGQSKSMRRSVNISVRRSSRFMGRGVALGSVAAVAEYSEAKVTRKGGRRSGGFGLVIPASTFRNEALYREQSSAEDGE